MKTNILIIVTLLFSMSTHGQVQTDTIDKGKYYVLKKVKDSIEVRNFIGFSPSRAKKINGLSVKYWSDRIHSKTANGIELDFNFNPLVVAFLPVGILYSPIALIKGEDDVIENMEAIENITFLDKTNGIKIGVLPEYRAMINGLELNLVGGVDSKVNGISINALISIHYSLNGIGLTPLINSYTKVNGMQIGLFNGADRSTGIQIGLFNAVNKLRGLQIGLWNKNDKRSLPFINWQFKD